MAYQCLVVRNVIVVVKTVWITVWIMINVDTLWFESSVKILVPDQ